MPRRYRIPGLRTTGRHRLRAGGASFLLMILAVGALPGCRVVSAHQRSVSAPPAIAAGNQQAPAVCSRRDPGSDFSLAVFAKTAASGLDQAHVTPNPWASLPPNTVIFACFVTNANRLTQGEYVDSSGESTPVPAGTFNDCLPPDTAVGAPPPSPAAACSFRLGVHSSRSVNPAIAAVLGVVVIAVVWIVVRRRRRPTPPSPRRPPPTRRRRPPARTTR